MKCDPVGLFVRAGIVMVRKSMTWSRSIILCRGLIALPVLLVLSSSPSRAEYLIASGDLLDITVFRVPELTREVAVDIEGRIAFPPLGLVDVAGTSLEMVGETIRDRLADKEILGNAQVTVALTSARPVFVGGDVASPGAFPFQAGLSVRRAVALAGGIGQARGRGPEELAALRSEYDVLTANLLGDEARLARLRAELAGERDLAAELPSGTLPERDGRSAELLELESRRLSSNTVEAEEQKAHLARILGLVEDRIETLSGQAANQRSLIEQQTLEVVRYRDLRERGLTPQIRLAEEQRIFDNLVERAADTASAIALGRQQKEDAAHALERFDARRRAALELEAQEALLAIETRHAQLRGVTEQIAQLGLAREDQVRLTLYRPGATGEIALEASADMILQPGDMVEVEIEFEFPLPGLGAAPHAAGRTDPSPDEAANASRP